MMLVEARLKQAQSQDFFGEYDNSYRIEVSKGGKHVKTFRISAKSRAHALVRAKSHYPGHYISSISEE
jgi:hypothetical protein